MSAAAALQSFPPVPCEELADRAREAGRRVLAHADPCSAARRWLCDAVRGWAPLEVLFPAGSHADVRGVSGEMPLHELALIEREYGHVVATTRNLGAARRVLIADRDWLAAQIGEAEHLARAHGGDVSWLPRLRDISLAMAEYLHRHAIGLNQILPDDLVMTYTADIARTQRLAREQCFGFASPTGARQRGA